MMGVSPSVIGSTSQKAPIHPDSIRILSEYMFLEVTLAADQRLQVRGDQVAKLAPCPCLTSALDRKAGSLSHAFTTISEACDTLRRSHTRNVFGRAFADNDSEKRSSLDGLRLRAIQKTLSGAKSHP